MLPLSALSLIAVVSAAASADLRESFADPPPEFRPTIITHGYLLNQPNGLAGLRAKRSGGAVIDVGITPGSKDQGLEGEVHTNPTYLNDPERFAAMRGVMNDLHAAGEPIWIYDELAYPSASAGGHVIDGHPEYAPEVIGCRVLKPSGDGAVDIAPAQGNIYACYAAPLTEGVFDLGKAIDLSAKAKAGPFAWNPPGPEWAVCALDHYFPDTWKRHNIYRRFVNIMNREAIARFIEVTHERYAKELGPQLAQVFSFFTDEPQLGSVENWSAGLVECEPMAPWCPGFAETFKAKKGYDLGPILPALFLDVGPATPKYRYDFYDAQSDIVAENYFEQVEAWCHAHGTLSSGHLLLEESLLLHLMFSGSMMKDWAHMDLPGVDLLLGAPYKTMPGWEAGRFPVPEDFSNKMASSVAHLREKRGTFSESFALAKISPRAARGVAAWQYAGGVTHMTTYTIQSQFSNEEYAGFSDFTGRLALLARRGRHVADVALLVPEPAIWASYTPPNGGRFGRYIDCNPVPARIDQTFRACCHTLGERHRDFDCFDDGLLLDAAIKDGRLHLAGESFAFLIVPEAHMMRRDIAEKIAQFSEHGGHVVFVGRLPFQTPDKGSDPDITVLIEALMAKHPERVRHIAEAAQFGQAIDWMAQRVPPVLMWDGPSGVRILHRRESGREIILLANPGKGEAQGNLRLAATGRASLWSPETGDVQDLGPQAPASPLSVGIPAESARFIILEAGS